MRAIGLGGRLAAVAAIAAARAGMVHVVVIGNDSPPPPQPQRPRRTRAVKRPKFSGFDPRVNRWTGKPHEHAREIARRLRQAQS